MIRVVSNKRRKILQDGTLESIASATTIDLSNVQNRYVRITGSTTIENITASNFNELYLIFDSECKINPNIGNIRTLNDFQLWVTANEVLHLYWDATNLLWRQCNILKNQQPREIIAYSDFPENQAIVWGNHQSGTSATSVGTKRENGIIGIRTHQTGTTASGRQGLFLGDGSTMDKLTFGTKGFVFLHKFKIPILSDSVERFTVRSGFVNATNSDGTNSLFVKYSDNVNSGKFQILAIKNSVATATIDSGITVVDGQYYEIYIEINNAGDRAEVFINNALVASVATTANLPNGSSEPLTAGGIIQKSVGTTSRELDTDKMLLAYY